MHLGRTRLRLAADDVYGLGATLFYLFSAEEFQESTQTSTLLPHVPPQLFELIFQSTQPDESRRPSCDQLLTTLTMQTDLIETVIA